MIVVTGGAGLIGSAVVWLLNTRGRSDIILVDERDHEEKEHNVAPLQYEEQLSIADFHEKLREGFFDDKNVEAVIHLGAISSTTETDWQKLELSNVAYTQDIIRWCVDRKVRGMYASSGQTYGTGEQGYSDDHTLFDKLKTVTLYGKSKLLVDIWARDAGYLEQVVGLRYFNVFGPNEYHKEHMRSVILKQYERVANDGYIELFKSYHPEYADGEQQRDFLYLKDAAAVTVFFLDNPSLGGVFNVGTGQARTWNAVASAMFAAVGKEPKIHYVDMPENLRAGYQYFTQADISKLRAAGYTADFTSLEDSVDDYIRNYLAPHKHLGEK